MNTELMKCPFCGGNNGYLSERSGQFAVICDCGATGPTANTKQEALTGWNKRAQNQGGKKLRKANYSLPSKPTSIDIVDQRFEDALFHVAKIKKDEENNSDVLQMYQQIKNMRKL